MRKLPNRQDSDLDAILSGSGPIAGAEDDALVAFVEHVRLAARTGPGAAVEDRHVSALVETAQLFVEKGEPVARPASKAAGPDRQVSRLPKRRRKFVLSSLFATLTAKLAAGGVAVAMATTGGLAATGELPAPAQDAIARAAEVVGIHLPTSEDEVDEVIDEVIDDVTDRTGDETGEVIDDVTDGTGDETNGSATSAAVHEAINSTEPGPERGQAVSEAASGKPHPNSDGVSGNGNSTSSAVQEAINSTEPGPERGKAVSEAASSGRAGGGDDSGDEIDTEDTAAPGARSRNR